MSIALDLPEKGVLSPNDEHDPLPMYFKPGIGLLFRQRLKMALALVPSGGRVLEVGVGSGIMVPTLTRHFDEYVGTDLVLAHDLERLVRPGCKASFVQADILDAESLPRDAFDVVICISVLEHIGDSDAAARTLARALKPGGRLVTGYPMVNPAMSRAFDLIGFRGIDQHHVSTPRQIAGALRRVARPVARRALPPLAPPALALYQVTSWTK